MNRLEQDIKLVENIKWKSIDKDNMEFETRTTCYVRDALQRILEVAKGELE